MKNIKRLNYEDSGKLRTKEAFEVALAVRNFIVLTMRETQNEDIYRGLLRVVFDLERSFPILWDEFFED